MKTKRIIALLLIAVLSLGALSSCAASPEEVMAKADQALLDNPYSVTSSISYSTGNEEINAVLNAISIDDIVMIVDGENIQLSTGTEMMGFTTKVDYIIVDKVMYATVNVAGMTQKAKANLTDTNLKDFMDELASTNNFSADEFENLELTKDGNTYILNCTEASQKYLDAQLEAAASQLEALDADITVDNIKLSATIEDDKYKTMEMVCTFTVTIKDASYSMTIKYNNEFSYGEEFAVAVPSDAGTYAEVDFDDFFDK